MGELWKRNQDSVRNRELPEVFKQLVFDNYAFQFNQQTYQLNAQGERFARNGGYKTLHKEEARSNAIKEKVDESMIKTNQSVVTTNKLMQKTNVISLIVAIAAVIVAALPFATPNNQETQLKILNQKLDSINHTLIKIEGDSLTIKK